MHIKKQQPGEKTLRRHPWDKEIGCRDTVWVKEWLQRKEKLRGARGDQGRRGRRTIQFKVQIKKYSAQ